MKVIYLNKETGKEVYYGENITFKESGKIANGYSYQRETTLPIINRTIPDLIKKGVLVQKEVKDDKEDCPLKEKEKISVHEKLDRLAMAIAILLEKVDNLENSFLEILEEIDKDNE